MVLHKELYASISLLSAVLYIGLLYLGVDELITTVITIVIGFSARMAAVKFGWCLPVFHLDITEDQPESIKK